MLKSELQLMQNYPLWMKIEKSKQRIIEWVDHYGEDGVYISFSGGKDSTVLLHLVRSLYPNIEGVFSNTGLEFPEIVQFVKKQDNITIIKPKENFKQVIEKYGYPIISKEQSNYIYRVRNTKSQGEFNKYFHGINRDGTPTQFKVSEKYKYLIDAPFKISDKCCDKLKKNPVKSYEKLTGKVPIIGTMVSESRQRKIMYLKDGCNAFSNKRAKSTPIGFWTEQDILQYIVENNLEIASVYGDIIVKDGIYITTGEQRTGCIWCPLGAHLQQEPNRYQRLKETHPQLYDYCMDKLGLREVLEYIDVKY
ncbi:MAG: phosphoadenosine phosphosulfate reductase family protein [Peptostreptococcaceae bacterium]